MLALGRLARCPAACASAHVLNRRLSSLPKHTLLPMPALSPTMSQGNLAVWKKKEGDVLAAGDVIAEVETDKATVDFELVDEGILAKILVPEGTADISVGTPVAVLVDEAADVAAFKDYAPPSGAASAPAPAAAPTAAAAPAALPAAPAAATPAAPAAPSAAPALVSESGAVAASPLAKRLAAQMGVALSSLRGTGPGGRVIAADVSEAPVVAAEAAATTTTSAAAAPALPEGAAYIDIPNTQIRKITAKRMLENKNGVPHYYVTTEVCMDELAALRKKTNELLGSKISVNEFIIKACALALKEVPACNTSWTDEYVRQYAAADISVAVNTDRGLLTPIVFGADTKKLADISSEFKGLAARAKENKLKPEEFVGGTFTISNLGMMGVAHFTAIINAPQACILAVGGTKKVVVPNEGPDAASSPFVTKSYMAVTLSSDHRMVDGAIAATWLQAFKKYIENPLLLIL